MIMLPLHGQRFFSKQTDVRSIDPESFLECRNQTYENVTNLVLLKQTRKIIGHKGAWPSLAETCKGLILLLKTLFHLMEFSPNFTYMVQSATAEDMSIIEHVVHYITSVRYISLCFRLLGAPDDVFIHFLHF
jgi:hypothetical protein